MRFILGLGKNESSVWEIEHLRHLKMHRVSFPFEFLHCFHTFINLSEELIKREVKQHELRSVFNALNIHINHNLLWDLIRLGHGSIKDLTTLASYFQTNHEKINAFLSLGNHLEEE